jgi:hypothetical protein
MRIVNEVQFNPHPVDGTNQPEVFWGDDEPSTSSTFTAKNVGSKYWQRVTANHIKHWFKVKHDSRADDWVLERGIICQRLLRAGFTDGGSTSGTHDLNGTIPAGAVVQKTIVTNITGFTGDTSATIIVGVTGGDTDRYMTGTPSVFTTAAAGVDVGVPSGTAWLTAAAEPTALITSAADFTNVAAGAVTVAIFYIGAAV